MSAHHVVATLVAAASFVMATPVIAGPPPVPNGEPDESYEFPAGQACSNFGLRLDIWQGAAAPRQVKDRNGVIRAVLAGGGAAFRTTNLLTGKSTTVSAGGASQMVTTYTADGTQKLTLSGHFLLIWFPTDIPAGPWTSAYTGKLVMTLSPDFVGRLVSLNGAARDICTELS